MVRVGRALGRGEAEGDHKVHPYEPETRSVLQTGGRVAANYLKIRTGSSFGAY